MANFKGTSVNDSLKGTSVNDLILGFAGDDSLSGNLGNDELDGGDGNDTLFGFYNQEDIIPRVPSPDGNNKLSGGNGNDSLFGSGGDDLLYGDNGDDRLSGSSGKNLLDGGAGNDTLISEGNDTVYGGSGNDSLQGESYSDIVLPAVGSLLDAGCGDDTISGPFTGTGTLYGGSGNDLLSGGDSLFGGTGNDTLAGLDDNDSLDGGDGNDIVAGNRGDDNLSGGTGNDTLLGLEGNDLLKGGDGNDILLGAGNISFDSSGLTSSSQDSGIGEIDTLVGGIGRDTFALGSEKQSGILYDDGNKTTAGVSDYARIQDFNKSQDFIQLKGALTNYFLAPSPTVPAGTAIYFNKPGNEPDELIAIVEGAKDLDLNASYFTTTGNDSFVGSNGSEKFDAGRGNDTLFGSSGIDTLIGGTGRDTFALGTEDVNDAFYDDGNTKTPGLSDYALIQDFNPSQDFIQLKAVKTNYFLTPSPTGLPTGTAIYFNKQGNEPDELIAIVAGAKNLDLNASYFTTTGDDSFNGSNKADRFDGGKGNDTLSGGSGNDTLIGGTGNDILLGNNYGSDVGEIDALVGGAGRDIFILGNEDQSLVFYDDGNRATAGVSDYIRIQDFNKSEDFIRLKGGRTNYFLAASPTGLPTGTAIYFDKPGNEPDELIAIVEGVKSLDLNASYFTTTGDDRFNGSDGADRFDGGRGNDSLDGELGNDSLIGGSGNDVLEGGYTGYGDDTLIGGTGDDTLFGYDGNDILIGESGNDSLYGGNGSHSLSGGSGNDVLEGGGDDSLIGGAGNDTLTGGIVVNGGNGDDILSGVGNLIGGTGRDTFAFGSGGGVTNYARIQDFNKSEDFLQFSGSKNNYLLTASPTGLPTGTAVYFDKPGNEPNALIAIIEGASNLDLNAGYFTISGNDSFSGTDENDRFDSGRGNDSLNGGSGNDTLIGGTGDDTIQGFFGNDSLVGGEGNDDLQGSSFVLYSDKGSGKGEIDTLVGGAGIDAFALRDLYEYRIAGALVGQVLYNDGDPKTPGTNDYALIQDFNKSEDIIELAGKAADYSLGSSPAGLPKGTGIFLGTQKEELIGIVQGVTGLSLTANYFSFYPGT